MIEIHLQFPNPGEWDKFTMTARYEDADGYTLTDHYTQDNIPADQAPALAAAVDAISGMDADWQASQAWARLVQITTHSDDQDRPPITITAVELTVEAVNADGGSRTFTAYDYASFILRDPGAVAFFRHFTDGAINS